MSELSFSGLLEALLRVGIAPRHARRAVMEVADHFDDLVAAARAQGLDEPSACMDAQNHLGAPQDMLRAYADRSELHSRSRRRPILFFILLPLLGYSVIASVTLLLLAFFAARNAALLRRLSLPVGVTHGIDLTAQVIFLWLLPCMIGVALAVLAHRRRAPAPWPLMGILGISVLASLCNVVVSVTSGAGSGAVGGGIGISWDTLPERIPHAALLGLPAVLLWRFLTRRQATLSMAPVA